MSLKTDFECAIHESNGMGWIVAIILVIIMICGIVYNSMRVATLEAGIYHLEIVVEKNKHDIVELLMREER